MAAVDHGLQVKLEYLFDMRRGYVLEFSDRTFAEFIHDSIGIHPYEVHQGSKAQVLRHLWSGVSDDHFVKLTSDMLDYRRLIEDIGRYTPSGGGQGVDSDRRLVQQVQSELLAMANSSERLTKEQATFLAKDFGAPDLNAVHVPVDLQSVVADRLQEIEACLEHHAYLSVMFLCGSTLEGLLFEAAKGRPADFNQARAAARHDGRVLPFQKWPLSAFLDTARELNLLGEDVVKHGHSVREFRNYIHPQQQVKEGFRPRRLTAQMARHVLLAAIDDLSHPSR